MPVNRNALIRYKTIDVCLQNKYRRWTLDDLINACSDALYEFEGIDKGISRRTVQTDIQMMRSEKLGYNAPIVVYENRYYKYSDENYSITNTPLSEQDLKTMTETVVVLRQFKGFSNFSNMSDIVHRLVDHVNSVQKKTPLVIDFEKNDNLKGLDYLDNIHQAIMDKQTLLIEYRSFKARSSNKFIFHPYLLKEYRNRWFVFGRHKNNLLNLALDRILKINMTETVKFIENNLFDTSTFFNDVLGVTKNISSKSETIRFWADKANAPYIQTKPLHQSQKLIETNCDGSMIFELDVVINNELQREILGFANSIKILSPESLANIMHEKFTAASNMYNS